MSQKVNEIIFGNESKIEGNNLYVNESDFEIPHGTDYNIAIEELYEIQKCSVNGINFLELFQYDDFSMWWFIYQSLIPKYKQITNFIDKYEMDKKLLLFKKLERIFIQLDQVVNICFVNEKQNNLPNAAINLLINELNEKDLGSLKASISQGKINIFNTLNKIIESKL